MIKNRNQLEEVINKVSYDYAHNNKIINKVTDELVNNHNLSRGRVIGIFTQNTPINYFNNEELCLITKYLFQFTQNSKLKLSEWYNPREIAIAEIYKNKITEKVNRIILHNVDQISSNQWLSTKENYQYITYVMSNGLVGYNMRTQRKPIKKKYGDKTFEIPNIKTNKVEEIKNEMVAGTFNPNVIIWNIRKESGMEKFKYNSKERILTIEINENTHVDIIDGANRTGGILRAVEEKSDISLTTSIMIYYVDEEKAQQIIYQEAQTEPLEEEIKEFFNLSNKNMEIVKNINSKQRLNEMFNRIGMNEKDLKYEGKLCTFETLSETIKYVYSDLNKKRVIDVQNIEKYLIEFFNELIGINYEVLSIEKLKETRKNSYIADDNMFIGYIALAQALNEKYNENWKENLQIILKQIDFRKTNPRWTKIGIESRLNQRTVKRIADYFRSLVLKGGVQNAM